MLKLKNKKSKKTLMSTGVSFVLIGSLVMFSPSWLLPRLEAFTSKKDIYIPDADYSFQESDYSKSGETLSHKFMVFNARPYSVPVSVEPDCGCTSVSWRKAIIPPFSSQQIEASVGRTISASTVRLSFKYGTSKYIFARLTQNKNNSPQ